MAWDFDMFSDTKPVKGQVATADGSYNGVLCTVTLASAVDCATLTWTVEESTDGGSTYGTAADTYAIYRVASSGTATAFHCSTNSKASTVRFKAYNNGTELTSGSTPAATYTITLGHPTTAPFLSANLKGIEDNTYADSPPSH